MKKLLTILSDLREYTHVSMLYIGFGTVLIFGIIAWSYMSGVLVLDEGEVTIHITEAITRWGGRIAYFYIGWAVAFLVSHATPYVLRFRNWWVHSKSHKITREVYLQIRGLD